MDFSEALKLLKQGAVMRRASWSGTKRIVLMAGSADLEILPYIGIVTKDGNSWRIYRHELRYTR